MKKLLFLSLVALGLTVKAQLYVQPTSTNASYVFVNDALFFVKQDVELVTNSTLASASESEISNILLRGKGQLLQGQGVDRDNKGTGDISVYQEGTVNQFDYNFWASPVGLSRTLGTGISGPARANGNTPFAFRNAPSEKILNLPLTVTNSDSALNNGGYDGFTSPGVLSIAHYWLFSYKSSSGGYADWTQIGNTGELEAGYGFTMKGVSGTDNTTISTETGANNSGGAQRYDFRGRPNNGDISGVTVGVDEDVLVGNPYPSAMDLSYFLIENSAPTAAGSTETYDLGFGGGTVSIDRKKVITGVAYFWDSKAGVNSHYLENYEGGYGTFSPMNSPLGAGMYVEATYQNYDELGNGIGNDTGPGAFYERRFSPVGQGFFLLGDSSQGTSTLTFSNRHRVYVQEGAANNSEFRTAQNQNPVPGIGVETFYPDVTNMDKITEIYLAVGINNLYTRQLGIGIIENATEGFDFAVDAPINGALPTDVAFASDYTNDIGKLGNVIAGIGKDQYQWVPLKLQVAETSEFKFKVFRTAEFSYDNIFLLDSLTNTYHDILNDEMIISLEEGVYEDRFFVRFTTETAPPEEETEDEIEDNEDISIIEQDPFSEEDAVYNSFIITQNNNDGQLEIYNPDNIVVKDVALYDITGKQIFKELDLGNQNEYSFSTKNLTTGIYVVQFVTIDGLRKAQKIRIIN
ncbi:T9SS type A sorting domain-containing protein [Dokdonia sp. Hel_I_53]|uniref:T9SS type A sorting domain-containing protein n=1 Tax=Dokdonia sp. Hel_I_53 TaxID=1566287 RepID=UPI00119A7E5B|nr:T9SS type A sorting domain-containing protein [Dokdonia sp. Hel_I_53]TVZ51828.1 putative secreted protein (Por secretion system target) [Dokdonia sp. Hel_I_53]